MKNYLRGMIPVAALILAMGCQRTPENGIKHYVTSDRVSYVMKNDSFVDFVDKNNKSDGKLDVAYKNNKITMIVDNGAELPTSLSLQCGTRIVFRGSPEANELQKEFEEAQKAHDNAEKKGE